MKTESTINIAVNGVLFKIVFEYYTELRKEKRVGTSYRVLCLCF